MPDVKHVVDAGGVTNKQFGPTFGWRYELFGNFGLARQTVNVSRGAPIFTSPFAASCWTQGRRVKNSAQGLVRGCRRFYLSHRPDCDDWISLAGGCVE